MLFGQGFFTKILFNSFNLMFCWCPRLEKSGAASILLLFSCSLVFLLLASFVSVWASSGWSQTYGGPDADGALSLIQTADGGYCLAGYTRSFGAGKEDIWLVKVDSSGNMQWNRTYGGLSLIHI